MITSGYALPLKSSTLYLFFIYSPLFRLCLPLPTCLRLPDIPDPIGTVSRVVSHAGEALSIDATDDALKCGNVSAWLPNSNDCNINDDQSRVRRMRATASYLSFSLALDFCSLKSHCLLCNNSNSNHENIHVLKAVFCAAFFALC